MLSGIVPLTIFQTLGEKILRVPTLQATSATGTATFTFTGTAGYTVDAGAVIEIDGIDFETTVDLVVAPGPTTGDVPIVAQIAGAAGSGISGDAVLISPTYLFVDSVEIASPTTGGLDGETGQGYIDRLPDEIPTFSSKAILIEDFAAIARADLEVFRALAIDNFVPPSTTGVEGAVTVALMDSSGAPVSSGAKTRVENALEGGRVLNLDVHVIDPAATQVDVDFTATAFPGYDPAAVEAEAIAAIQTFLAPVTWGVPPGGDPELWVDETTLRRNDLMGALYKVEGIRHVVSLTLALHGGGLTTSDVTLTGPAAVPASNSVVTGSVT